MEAAQIPWAVAIALLAAGGICVSGYLVVRAVRALVAAADFPLPTDDLPWPEEKPRRYIPRFFVSHTGDSLRASISITGAFYRWQPQARFWGGADLWRTFQDGPWRWDAQGRFAGKGLNCGHYFSLTEAGATIEMTTFGANLSSGYGLLVASMRLDRILDLTSYDGMAMAAEAVVSERTPISLPFFSDLAVEGDQGGTAVTDRVGYWAYQQGYVGILFLGARAIRPEGGRDPSAPTMRDSRLWDYDLFYYDLENYRDRRDQLNLVVFRGNDVLSALRRYTFQGTRGGVNPYFGMAREDIEQRLGTIPEYAAFGASYQSARNPRAVLAKIVFHDLD